MYCTGTSEPDRGFSEWENNYTEFIENGGDVFEFENEDSPEEVQPETSNNAKKNSRKSLEQQLETLQELNEFALTEGKKELFLSTQKSIRELQLIKCDSSTLLQPSITKYFNLGTNQQ